MAPVPPREIELKLEVDPKDVARLKRRLSQLSVTKPLARTLVSAYFDTARWVLREHRLSLRVRRIGHQYVQTVKSAAARRRVYTIARNGSIRHTVRNLNCRGQRKRLSVRCCMENLRDPFGQCLRRAFDEPSIG